MPENSNGNHKLAISIVTYCPDTVEFSNTLKSLKSAIEYVHETHEVEVRVMVIDNSVDERVGTRIAEALLIHLNGISDLMCSTSNIGYGLGHNLASINIKSQWYLFMNADVELEVDVLSKALTFFQDPANHSVGLISPRCTNGNGQRAYLCKRYPSVFDFALRGFAPRGLKKKFKNRLDHYEYRNVTEFDHVHSVSIASGCFMFLRSEAWNKVGGFSDDYFLYFEDFDLCMRLNKFCDIAYVPSLHIIHHGGNAARKGFKHVCLFARSACRFFATHGWRLV